VRSGVQLPLSALTGQPLERFQLVDEAGRLLAIAHAEAGRVVYERVFVGSGAAKA
jgi:hypothetical protein